MTGIRQKHTPRFAAPELVLDNTVQSKTRESDVYAFGMLVLQAVTEQLPWGVDTNDIAVILAMASGRHPPQPISSSGFVSISHAWWDVCKSCWTRDPGQRPRMPFVLDVLTQTALEPYRRIEGHRSSVHSVTYLPCGRRVVSASQDGTIRIWDTLTGRMVIGPLCDHKGPVYSVAVSPDGRQICSGGGDRSIRRWDADSGAPIGAPMIGHDNSVTCVAFSPDSMRIVSCSYDRTVRLWDATNGGALRALLDTRRFMDQARCVAFSPDGACVATAYDSKIRLLDSATGADVVVLHQPAWGVQAVCFSPDRIHLVSGCSNGAIYIWNLSTQQLAHNIKAHSARVASVAVSPSGRYIVSGLDGEFRIWDAQSGHAVGVPLTGHARDVFCVGFSPDGRSVVSGSTGELVRIWDLFE